MDDILDDADRLHDIDLLGQPWVQAGMRRMQARPRGTVVRCPGREFGKLAPEPFNFGGPHTYGCVWHNEPFATADTGCGWNGRRPPGLLRRLVRRVTL